MKKSYQAPIGVNEQIENLISLDLQIEDKDYEISCSEFLIVKAQVAFREFTNLTFLKISVILLDK